jgi:ArsR family transcriptional regulator
VRDDIDGCQFLRQTGAVTSAATAPAPPAASPIAAVCCTPITAAPLGPAAAEQLAAVLKAIADPARLRLLSLIAAQPAAEACVCELTEPLGLGQPTVSHHLKILTDAGLLARDKRGVWAYYRLVPDALPTLAHILAAPAAATPPARTG